MCCKEIRYRGCIIYKNLNEKANTYYWSIANPHKHPKGQPNKHFHCHARSKKMSEKIVDCYQALRKYGVAENYPTYIKNKALRLDGIYIHECY